MRTFFAAALVLMIQTLCMCQEVTLGTVTFKDGTIRSGVIVADSPGEFCVLRDASGREEVHWYSDIIGKTAQPLPPDSPLADEQTLRSAEVLSSARAVMYDSVYTIHLKNGQTRKGVLLLENWLQTVTLLDPNGVEWKYNYKNIDRIERGSMPEGVQYLKIRHHFPSLAGVCSMFLPGGGQYYNEQWVKGGLFTASAVLGISKLFYGRHDYRDMVLGIIITFFSYIVSIADAVGRASSLEKAREEWEHEQKTLRQSGSSSLLNNLNLAPLPQGVAVGLSVRF